MNRDFEFKQILRAYRAGVITEAAFEQEMAMLEKGHANGDGAQGFRALGKTYASEREAVAATLDRLRAGEANGKVAFSAWAEQCTTECIRSGIRIIAEREGCHARIFERRMKDLGLKNKAQVTEASRKITERLGDASTPDNQKLLYINSLTSDVEAFFKPICDLAENIKEDLESKELLKLYVEDELSSAKWLQYACAALNGDAPAVAAKGESAESIV